MERAGDEGPADSPGNGDERATVSPPASCVCVSCSRIGGGSAVIACAITCAAAIIMNLFLAASLLGSPKLSELRRSYWSAHTMLGARMTAETAAPYSGHAAKSTGIGAPQPTTQSGERQNLDGRSH